MTQNKHQSKQNENRALLGCLSVPGEVFCPVCGKKFLQRVAWQVVCDPKVCGKAMKREKYRAQKQALNEKILKLKAA